MAKPVLRIIIGSTRPGRVGPAIAEWIAERAREHGGFDVEVTDLAELNLPMYDEPNHPRTKKYVNQHTKDWSALVAASDAFIFVTPEYNYSFSPALKNALDFLGNEWWRKPLGFVSYGGVSGGTRGVAAIMPITSALGLVRVGANVELNFGGAQVVDGVFQPKEKEIAILAKEFEEVDTLAGVLTPARSLLT